MFKYSWFYRLFHRPDATLSSRIYPGQRIPYSYNPATYPAGKRGTHV